MTKYRNRYRNYLTIEAFVILLVIITFKVIADRPLAALVASLLFLISSLGILGWEIRHPGFYKRSTFWGFVAFLVLSVLPILGLRLWYWGEPWEAIALWGISGPALHEFSNKVFLMVMICIFADSYLETKKQVMGIEDKK